MIEGFKQRRWWAAALVSLLFGPFMGMLYLGRGRIALAYLAVSFVLYTLLTVFWFPGLVHSEGHWAMSLATELPLNLIGAVHGAALARRDPLPVLPRYSRWYWLVAIWLLFPLAALCIRSFVVKPYNVASASMSPTLNIGDYIFVSRWDHAPPQRGDLIVFRTHDGDFIKRVVGVGGDRLRMTHGALILNGKPVARRRIEAYRSADFLAPVPQYRETLPSGRSYRTLDLMANSPLDDTPEFVVPSDHYFVLGDNRDNSDDSRLDVGFVARRDVVGKIVVKFSDAQHTAMIWQRVE